jgi:hypothetical protein
MSSIEVFFVSGPFGTFPMYPTLALFPGTTPSSPIHVFKSEDHQLRNTNAVKVVSNHRY